MDLIELEFTRKFLTPTARTQGQKIGYFIDAFDMVTPTEVGEMANSLSRNEILSANEFRSILGFKPNNSERSDQLINKNIPIKQIDPNAVDNQSTDSFKNFDDDLNENFNDDLNENFNESNQNEMNTY